MTLQQIPLNFLTYEENFIFFFINAEGNRMVKQARQARKGLSSKLRAPFTRGKGPKKRNSWR